MLICSPFFNILFMHRMKIEVKDSRSGDGDREPYPHAANISIFPFLVPRVLRAA